jgi:hypothetical protein
LFKNEKITKEEYISKLEGANSAVLKELNPLYKDKYRDVAEKTQK